MGNTLVRSIALAAVQALCVYVSIAFTRGGAGIATVWLASGILVGVILTSPRSLTVPYLMAGFVGHFVAKLIFGDPLALALATNVAGIVESALVVASVRQYAGPVDRLAGMPATGRVATLSTLAACGVSAAIAMVAHFLLRDLAPWQAFLYWFPAHVLGMVIFATLTIVVRVQRLVLLVRRGRRFDFAVSLGLVVVVAVAVFWQSRYPALFLVLPPMLMIAYRHGFPGVAFAMAAITVIGTVFTLTGHGPMSLVTDIDLGQRSLLLQAFIATACVTGLPVAFAMTEQRRLAHLVGESEQRYRVLADYSRDLVVRIAPDGHRTYISPSAKEILGYEPEELLAPRWELVHPDDRAPLAAAMAELSSEGGTITVSYRAQHRDGHYVWIEANATRVQGADGGFDIIYAGRDVSRRVRVEQDLANKERQLRSIADNMPAMISLLDHEERYVFASENVGRLFGLDPADLIGRSMREVRGEAYYSRIREHTAAALRGERARFEFEADLANGERHHFQAEFLPDVDRAGRVVGFYAMGVDITPLKLAERELDRQARQDSLTGLSNRRHFNERLELALERNRRSGAALALMCMDIDKFKRINDTLGHAVGDEVLRVFAQRLLQCVRSVDAVARLGGDEFVVLLEEVESEEVPEQVARRLIALMDEPVVIAGTEVRFSASIGIGYCRRPVSADALMQLADAALYRAKDAGRDTYRMQRDETPLMPRV